MIFGKSTEPENVYKPEIFLYEMKKTLENLEVPCYNTYVARECWNWQTGMTKDHVVYDREGSSPFSRTKTLILSDEF